MEDFVLSRSTTFSPEERFSQSGRVLSAVGLGASLEEALVNAYAGVEQISFENMHYRRDIARRRLFREEGI